MSYTPTNWSTGDTITASALNKIEQGIAGGGGGAVIIEDNETQLDKTFAEIYELVHSGVPCYIRYANPSSVSNLDTTYAYYTVLMPVVGALKYNATYRVYASSSLGQTISNTSFVGTPAVWTYQANISSDYPTFLRTGYTGELYSASVDMRYI